MPYWRWNGIYYEIYTTATTGSINTQYFGDKCDPDKIERKMYSKIYIYAPDHIRGKTDYTLTLEIEKVSMVVTGDSYDNMWVYGIGRLDPEQNYVVHNFTPSYERTFTFSRDVTEYDVDSNWNLPSMPGFRIKWSYNHEVKPDTVDTIHRLDYENNVDFRRYI